MTARPSSRKVLATDWNRSLGKMFDCNRAERVDIVFRNELEESSHPLTGVGASPAQLNTGTEAAAAHSLKDQPLRILMVEDNEDDCELITYRLQKCGYQPRIERVFCEEAMRAALEREQWDIVFTDHGLPGFSGSAALELLRRMGLQIPVLCITGTLDPAIIRQILAAGVSACISKDDLSLLCSSVARALNKNFTRESNKQRHS